MRISRNRVRRAFVFQATVCFAKDVLQSVVLKNPSQTVTTKVKFDSIRLLRVSRLSSILLK
jgi:hypothetical protein